MTSSLHGYPRVSSNHEFQSEYERQWDAAAEVQTAHFVVAPRQQVIRPLDGSAIGAGQELSVDDLIGVDDPPIIVLERLVLDGVVMMPRNLGINDPSVKRVATRSVDNRKVIRQPAEGWHPNPMYRMSDHIRERWERECRTARDQATVLFSVAPNAVLTLRDGSQLRPGQEVKPSHFRAHLDIGGPTNQLKRLVALGLVLEADRPERCTGASPLDDGPIAA